MVKFHSAIVCLMVMVIDLVAGILGIAAQIAQNKMKRVKVMTIECNESSHQAWCLGLAAIGLLVLAHVIANVLGRCMCSCSQKDIKGVSRWKKLSTTSLVLSWVLVAVGFTMLVIGVISNSRVCRISHHKFLAIGGVLCFFHGIICVAFSIFATLSLVEAKRLGAVGAQMT